MKHALRSLSRSPGFTAVALLTLALGIGASTSMFSLVNTLLFSTAPYPEPDRLVRVFRTSPQSQTWPHSLPNLADLSAASESVASLTAFQWWTFSHAEPGQPAERLTGVIASANLFATLNIQPTLGRGFSPDEQQPGRDRVVVLSHAFWQRLGGDPAILGRTLRIDAEPVTVIGVMPESAAYPLFWGDVALWRPLPLNNDWRQDRAIHWLNAIARLAPGIDRPQAQAEFSGLAAQLARDHPASNGGTDLRLVPFARSNTSATESHLSWLALGLSLFVLLIACANLANLQLARTGARAREFAVRAALGASRRRLIRPLIAESLLLAVIGGGLGVLLASWINDTLARFLARASTPLALPIDPAVLAFALLASLVTGLLFGLAPAWIASRADVNDALKQQTRGSTIGRPQRNFRQVLIVAEVALALVLLSGAGFFIRGLQRFMQRDPGWQTSGLIAGTITLPDHRYATPELRRTFHRELERRLAELPGVEQFSLSSTLPLAADGVSSITKVYVEGRPFPEPARAPLANYTVVSSSFFATLQISLVRGRLFPADLRLDAPPAIVINETMARQLWPGEDPIGRRVTTTDRADTWEEVIGVVRDVGFAAYAGTADTPMHFYRPFIREPWAHLTFAVRAAAPESLAEPLRRLVLALDSDLAVTDLRTIQQAIDARQNHFYVINRVLGGFAVLGLILAALGLYGVIAGFVVQRLPEFGVRLALGATPRNVLQLVLRKGLILAATGTLLGLAGSFVLVRTLHTLLPEFPGPDFATSLLNVAALFTVAALACWLPARRATRVDPATALRAE